MINWQNNRHSMTTLVSGIGWPEGSDLHSAPHVYSCYERQMFVDMSVKDVKFCFHNELVNLPANSFRKINMCKMQEANG